MNDEVWKDIEFCKGSYQVSSKGRVKSLERIVTKYNALTKRNNIVEIPEKILKPSINKYGYYRVSLNINGKRETYPIHRLVAEAFLENTNNLKTVNHIDKNKLNNNIENLEYMSIGDNVRHSLNKPVIKFDETGNVLEEYPSINEAGRQTKIYYQNIYKCCKGKRKTAGGYEWRYKDAC